MADAWVDYLARSSFLLQQGRRVTDVAYFYGEEAPLTSLYGDRPIPAFAGHDFDFVNREALRSRIEFERGSLRTPGGGTYRVLQLGGDSQRLTLATLQRIGTLLRAEAVVVGRRPLGSPSLADDPNKVARAIAALWGPSDARAPRRVGLGVLYEDDTPDAAFAELGVPPDWEWTGERPVKLAVTHRTLGEGEIYFVVNRGDRPAMGDLALRTVGRKPEFWHADTGAVESASYTFSGGRTRVRLSLAPGDAVFVVLRETTDTPSYDAPPSRVIGRVELPREGWSLRFQAGRGAPTGAREVSLASWSRDADPAVRYFSGIGTYSRSLEVAKSAVAPGNRVSVQLGDVRDVAEVRVNGQRIGVAWKPPFDLDITAAVRPGRNELTVAVANLWVNRLIGDAQSGMPRPTDVTGPTYRQDAPLRPSGLIGPVTIETEAR